MVRATRSCSVSLNPLLSTSLDQPIGQAQQEWMSAVALLKSPAANAFAGIVK